MKKVKALIIVTILASNVSQACPEFTTGNYKCEVVDGDTLTYELVHETSELGKHTYYIDGKDSGYELSAPFQKNTGDMDENGKHLLEEHGFCENNKIIVDTNLHGKDNYMLTREILSSHENGKVVRHIREVYNQKKGEVKELDHISEINCIRL